MGYIFLAQGTCLLYWISALSLTVSEHWLLLSVRIISFSWSVKYVKDYSLCSNFWIFIEAQ